MAFSNDQIYQNSADFASAKDVKEVKKDLAEVKNDVADIKQALFSIQNMIAGTHMIQKKSNSRDMAAKKLYNDHVYASQEGATPNKMSVWKKKLGELLDSYIDNLTIHGASRVFRGSIKQRLVWASIMLGVLAYFFFCAYALLMNYLNNSVITNMQEVHVDGLKLPSVTVCDYGGLLCRVGEYDNANSFRSCSGGAVDRLGVECWVNDTRSNCTAKKVHGVPECVTVNPNQTIIQRTDGRHKLFQFQVQPASKKVALFFHQHNELPTPYNDIYTYVVEDGKYNVVLKQNNYSRLPKPYPSKCLTERFQKESIFLYTKSLCKQNCYAKSLLAKCGTLNAYWLKAFPSLNGSESTEKINNHTEGQIRKCFFEFLFKSKHPCQCELPCKEIRYEARIEKFRGFTRVRKKTASIRFLVYFETMEIITQVTEVPSYDVTRFLADIGGIAGLLLGMSILSVFEVIFCMVLFMIKWLIS